MKCVLTELGIRVLFESGGYFAFNIVKRQTIYEAPILKTKD